MRNREKNFQQLVCDRAVREDLRGKSLKAAVLTGSAGMLDFVIRLGSTAILARLITPEHFGLIMMVTAITAIADQLRELGLSSATVQQKEISHAEVTNLFWINVLVSVVIALLTCALSPLVSRYYGDSRLTAITCVLATNFIFGGLMVQHQALLTRQLKLGQTSLVRLSASVISTAVAIGLAWLDFGYWALVWREVVRSFLLTAGMWRCLPWIPGLPAWNTDVRGLVRFGTNLTAANILGTISSGVDRFLLGGLWGAAPVAVYRQAYQLIAAPTDQLLSPLYQVTQPGLSLLQAEPVRYERYYRKVLTVVGLLTMPISLFVAVFSKEVTLLVLGPVWLAAAPVLMILSLGTFFKQAIGSAAFVLITRGESRTFLGLTVLQNAILILAMCIGVHWGPEGVAFADAATVYLLLAPRLYYSLKGSPVSARAFFSAIARPAAASLGMTGVLLALRLLAPAGSPGLTLVLAGMVAAIGFAGAWMALPGGRSELSMLVRDLRTALQQRMSRIRAPAPAPAAAH